MKDFSVVAEELVRKYHTIASELQGKEMPEDKVLGEDSAEEVRVLENLLTLGATEEAEMLALVLLLQHLHHYTQVVYMVAYLSGAGRRDSTQEFLDLLRQQSGKERG